MSEILIIYSNKDRNSADFFLRVFANTKVKPIAQEYNEKSLFNNSENQLNQKLITASAVFVLLTSSLEKDKLIKDKITWACAKASGKDIWVFEPSEQFREVKTTLAGFLNYARFENTDSWANYIKLIIDYYDNSNVLPALALTAGTGALLADKDKVAGGFLGALSGLALLAIEKANRPELGQPVFCLKCSHPFRIHLTEGTKDYRCVSCGSVYLPVPRRTTRLKNNSIQKLNTNTGKISLPTFLQAENNIKLDILMTKSTETPKTFISYSWDSEDHKNWVRELATKLRNDGIDVMLDQWHLVPGDQMAEFMERAVRENDYVLIVCTPNYKQKSDERTGGVGYEGDIMTGELAAKLNQRKFIPILCHPNWLEAAPSWLLGKFHINLTDERFEQNYEELLNTLHNQRTAPPPLGKRPSLKKTETQSNKIFGQPEIPHSKTTEPVSQNSDAPIKITGIIEEGISKPKMDGTRGSGLYAIPFQLSRRPPTIWSRLFIENWNHPPRFTTMHRPGIAKTSGDKIILDGTTINEVENYHRETLLLAVEKTNQQYMEYEAQERQKAEHKKRQEEEHKESLKDYVKRIKFD